MFHSLDFSITHGSRLLNFLQLNGWPNNVYAPSAIPYNDRHAKPKEMTKEDIKNFKRAFRASVERALRSEERRVGKEC